MAGAKGHTPFACICLRGSLIYSFRDPSNLVCSSPRAMGNLGAFFGAGATSTAFGNFADTPLYSDSQEYAPTSVMSVTTDSAPEMFGDQLAEERAMERVLDGDM